MIPVSLRIKNFMSYGENLPPIDFTRFKVAVMVGENGNGKSAIWDAITWCLWNRARGVDAGGKGVDDLVRLGADEMEVEFTFLLEGHLYRVIRKRKKGSHSILEFHMLDGNAPKVLTCDRISDTQEKINKIIKLDYETFIRSSFIPQNKAGIFTEDSPNDRKKVLGEVLGLGIYDELEEKAKEYMNRYERELAEKRNEVIRISEEIAKKELYINEKIAFEEKLGLLNDKRKDIEEKIAQKNLLISNMEANINILKAYQEDLAKKESEHVELNKRIADISEKIGKMEKAIQNKGTIDLQYEKLLQLRAIRDELNKKAIEYYRLISEQGKCEALIKNKKEMKLDEINRIKQEISKRSTLISEMPQLEKNIIDFTNRLKVIDEIEKQRDELLSKKDLVNKRISEIQSELIFLEGRLKELSDKYRKLEKTGSQCPICDSELTDDKKKLLLDETQKEGRIIKNRVQELNNELINKKQEISEADKKIRQYEAEIKKRADILSEYHRAEARLQNISNIQKELEGLKEHLQKLEEEFSNDEYLKEEKNLLKDILQKIKELGYDKEEHEQINLEIQKLSEIEEKKKQLEEWENDLKVETKTLEDLKIRLKEKEEDIGRLRNSISNLLNSVKGFEIIKREYEELKRDLEDNSKAILELTSRIAVLEDNIKKLETLEREMSKIMQEIQDLEKELVYYKTLKEAFSKKGIQALIIENAIPELEDEANRILYKITDGKLNVRFVTQKGTKKGDIVETLDIIISDELGERKYEMYSGGEAFRINFAIRVALSKLLAKRAGAKLQTLVIDEGLGSQDDRGRERLMEVIKAIQDDFEKVILITHISELKDVFPARIEVTKTSNGSLVNVVT